MTELQRFAALMAQRDAAADGSPRQAVGAEYQTEVRRLWVEANPRRKFELWKAEEWLGERLAAVQAPYRERLKAMAAEAAAARERLTAELGRLAPAIDMTPDPTRRTVFRTVHVSQFRSQPRCHHYARSYAELTAAEVLAAGVPAAVEPADEAYVVTVPLDPVRVEALRYRVGFPIKELVRQCWARGCNPRVIFPTLPEGLEEKFGLDYFGGEVTTKRV
jgi:hypothetical protein